MHSADPDFRTLGQLVDGQWARLSAGRPGAEAFTALVAPLERAARRSLTGPGRDKCVRVFDTHPEGFARLCSEALARGRNPVALLVHMVDAGDHMLDPPTNPLDAVRIPDPPEAA